jgi:hypothetical protein
MIGLKPIFYWWETLADTIFMFLERVLKAKASLSQYQQSIKHEDELYSNILP